MKRETFATYIAGFVISIVLTLSAFFAVTDPSSFGLSSGGVLAAILILAVAQLIAQLFFFLDLGLGRRDRARTATLLSAIGLVLIIVIGSIWIMSHLNYNMTPDQMNQYIQNQQGGF